ncbi:dihydrofolate reductase [Acinetobacter phage Acj9]|uniref:Frd dihydrofolate reductase n=1 Tax=Acinetobacter phage Acj9 TaxID=760939 RepID=E5EQ16_9CAUD|nr:dihydrofolate reductase [Acinetobacter phage Acj9]ADG60132.1 Frd dihydrofolate reductase [Acinetobacter phage Acj9]
MLQLVYAYGKQNGEFGAGDGLPWPHIREDFLNFRKRTLGTSLIMGSNTFASLPSKLLDRVHYVLTDRDRPGPMTKNGLCPDIPICEGNLASILENAHKYRTEYSVIGGIAMLEKALPYANRVVATEIVYNKAKGNKPTVFISPALRNLHESPEWEVTEKNVVHGDDWIIIERVLIRKMKYNESSVGV